MMTQNNDDANNPEKPSIPPYLVEYENSIEQFSLVVDDIGILQKVLTRLNIGKRTPPEEVNRFNDISTRAEIKQKEYEESLHTHQNYLDSSKKRLSLPTSRPSLPSSKEED